MKLRHLKRSHDANSARRRRIYRPTWIGIDYGTDGDCYYEGEYLGHQTCWRCGGEGSKVTCMDDLCHGAGRCIHGDGDEMCRECDGEGFL